MYSGQQNRIRMWEQMEDIKDSSAGRKYAHMFTVKEFSLAFTIGINTVYRLTKIEGFPVISIGGKKYILANEFKDWLMRNIERWCNYELLPPHAQKL